MRGVVKMRNNQSFYQVIKIGGDFLWVPIPSKRHFENPMMRVWGRAELSICFFGKKPETWPFFSLKRPIWGSKWAV